MEVRDISQGGQISYDISNNTNGSDIESSNNRANAANNIENTNIVSIKSQNNQQTNVNAKEVKKAVDKLNKLMEDTPTHLEYEIHGKFNDVIIKVVDDETKKVVQEIPPKKIIDMVDKLCELAGIFMDKKA